jgi:hypothetical protein
MRYLHGPYLCFRVKVGPGTLQDVPMHVATTTAFVDELEKIAAAHGLSQVAKARVGRRPISAAALVKKHNNGTWQKKRADSQGNPQDVRGDSDDDPGAARQPKRQGEVPTKERGDVPEGQKTGGTPLARHIARLLERRPDLQKAGMIPGANTQTQPFTSGEETTISAERRKPRQPGDVPTQGPAEAMIAPPSGGGISYGQARGEALRGKKKGDVPTRDRDLNLIDRVDLREGTTTVHGLGQHSTDIGAGNIPAEHT